MEWLDLDPFGQEWLELLKDPWKPVREAAARNEPKLNRALQQLADHNATGLNDPFPAGPKPRARRRAAAPELFGGLSSDGDEERESTRKCRRVGDPKEAREKAPSTKVVMTKAEIRADALDPELGRLGMVAGHIGENNYLTQYATGKPVKCSHISCKNVRLGLASGSQIQLGELRIGKIKPRASNEAKKRTSWYHPDCIFESFDKCFKGTKVILAPSDLAGFETLREPDRLYVKSLIDEYKAKRLGEGLPSPERRRELDVARARAAEARANDGTDEYAATDDYSAAAVAARVGKSSLPPLPSREALPPVTLERPRRSGAPPGATSKALPEAAAERLRGASVACAPPLPSPLPPLPPRFPPLLTSVASRLALEQPATRRKIAGASNSYPYEPVRSEVRIIRVPPAIDDDSAAAAAARPANVIGPPLDFPHASDESSDDYAAAAAAAHPLFKMA